MASEETVEEIVQEMRRDAVAADAWCETHGEMASAASVLNRHADRVEAAHKREVDSLNFKLMTANFKFMTAKSEQKTAANVIVEQTNKVEKLEREVAELRECLNDALTFVCSGCKDHTHKMCRFNRWRKALEGAKDEH